MTQITHTYKQKSLFNFGPFQEEVSNSPEIPGTSARGNVSYIIAKNMEILPPFGKHFLCFLTPYAVYYFVKLC